MANLRYAVHAYAWTSSWDNDCLDLIDRAKRIGFDAIEVPLMEVEKVDAPAIRERLDKVGLGVCTSTACSEATDPTGDDEATRQQALDYLIKCVQATADMGATLFTGVTYSAIGRRLDSMPDQRHWDRAAAVLKDVARYAGDLGVTVGIEAINRYETFLVNTGEQALRLIEMIDEPNVAVHLDAYHMNIEEASFYEATKAAAPHLCHYHLSESHRGTVGTGMVDWDGIYRALGEAGYTGMVGLESFVEPSPAMAAATCIWRPLVTSADDSLSQGLAYLKNLQAKHGL